MVFWVFCRSFKNVLDLLAAFSHFTPVLVPYHFQNNAFCLTLFNKGPNSMINQCSLEKKTILNKPFVTAVQKHKICSNFFS